MRISYDARCDISMLIGKTITDIFGMDDSSEEITITTSDGRKWGMYHDQDCCESVSIEDVEDVEGEIADLIGSPLIVAEESTNDRDDPPSGLSVGEYTDSCTWTFYRLATAKGMVVIRWYGESNGYYSESVDFGELV